MLDSIIIFSTAGIIAGIITGLTPGLHINTIAILALTIYRTGNINPLLLSCFIIAMSTAHSFLDFIPSIFFGVPDPATALTVLPTHKMLFEGKGYEALALSVIGGLFGMVILIFFLATIANLITPAYAEIKPMIPFLIIIAVSFIILKGKKRKASLFIFLISGILGMTAMSAYMINSNYIMFPLFAGLFGMSNLIVSFSNISEIPKQKTDIKIKVKGTFKSSVAGFAGGLVAGIIPGLGSSQSAMLVQHIGKMKGAKSFIIAVGTIGTIDIILSFLAIYLIGNARSGVAIAVESIMSTITKETLQIFIGIAFLSAGLAAILTLNIGKTATTIIEKIDYKKTNIAIMLLLTAMTMIFTGIYGFILLTASTSLGIYTQLIGVRRSMMMGCLIVPTILFFLGF
ncbi:MAG: tripartite tricarboxylate transporter permease [Candidatus Aenigmarchaeota archaeon]|nr:tripartite tricarboxylate transporter permease [Candidatus Aenigmarchaeota archaeon]